MRAVIAESYERIHRSNLLGMGVLPLQYRAGETAQSLGVTGFEEFRIDGVAKLAPGLTVEVRARDEHGKEKVFQTIARADTPEEVNYFRHGGILPYVMRQML